MGVVMPALILAFLGVTYDIRTYDRKYNVLFDPHKETEVSEPKSSATFMLVGHEDHFPYDYLGIPVDWAVRRKHTDVRQISGLMSHTPTELIQGRWKHNSVTLVLKIVHRTTDMTIKDYAPLPGRLDEIKDSSTHYVETFHNARQVVALFGYECPSEEDRKKARNIFTSRLGESGDITAETAEHFQQAVQELKSDDKLKDRCHFKENNFANVPGVGDDVKRPENWMKVVEDLQTSSFNGSIVSMELQPLSNFDERFPEVQRYEKQVDQLKRLDKLTEDLKEALMVFRFARYSKLSPEKQKEFIVIRDAIQKALGSTEKVAGDASIYRLMDTEQIKAAFHDYYDGLEDIGKKSYYKAVEDFNNTTN